MNKIIRKISAALQLVLLAPIKLPGKALNIVKYVALGLGILEKVTQQEDSSDETGNSRLSNEWNNKRDEIPLNLESEESEGRHASTVKEEKVVDSDGGEDGDGTVATRDRAEDSNLERRDGL